MVIALGIFALIEFIIIGILAVNLLIKKRTITESVISIGNFPYYKAEDEKILIGSPDVLKAFRKYIDGRIRGATSSLISDKVDGSKNEILKDIREIYKEKGAIKQLGDIRMYLSKLIITEEQ